MDAKYEITTPGAAGMLRQEQLAAKHRSAARPGHYVEDVSEEIMREYWLTECGGQRAVDAVLATLDKLANSEGYQRYALAEAARQVGAIPREDSQRRNIDVTLAYHRCPKHRETWLKEPLACESIHHRRGERFCPECSREDANQYRDCMHSPL